MAIRLLEGARRKLPLLFLLLAISAWSQNLSRRPDLLTEVPNVLCDAFLFEAKEAAGIIAVYSQCRSEAMEGIRSQFSNWRTMTREDRLQIFRDMNKHINRAFMEKTKAYFTKEEMVSVEKILAKQPAVDIELHALRLLELPKEHTKSLRASALAVVLVSPPRYLSRALEQSEEERQREE
ncbi:MAG: hypothetical protein RBU29_12250, partial [bacterium]|nr:hypothetical protein [bacterium]